MKKIASLTMAVIMLISLFTFIVSAQENVLVYIDGEKIEFDVQPQIINGRTLVPMRKIFEELGAVVDWDNSTQTAIGTKNNTTVKITINDNNIYKNGISSTLDVPAQLINGRTLVPVRAISEAFGIEVFWRREINTVSIHSSKENIEYIKMYNTDFEPVDVEKGLKTLYSAKGWTDNVINESLNSGLTLLKGENLVYSNFNNIYSIDNILPGLKCWTHNKVYYPEFGLDAYYYSYNEKTIEDAEKHAKNYARFLEGKGYVLICEMDDPMFEDDRNTNIIYELVTPDKKHLVQVTSRANDWDEHPNDVTVSIEYFKGESTRAKYDGYFNPSENLSTDNTGISSKKEFVADVDEIGTPEPDKSGIEINDKQEKDGFKLETIDDIESYLNTQYSVIKIGGKIHPIQYSVMLNIMDAFQWDVNITPKIGTNNEILMPLRMNFTTHNNKDKQEIVDSIRAFMEPLAKDIIAHFPKHKIICYFDEGYYKYPNIRVDYVAQNYFTWANYEYKLLGKNKTTKPEDFRWVYEHDTGGRLDFNDYFSDIEINTPATIENHFDNFVIRSLEYKGNVSLNYEGTEVNVTYEATANGSGFAYLNFYDKNGKLLGSEIEHFYSGTDEHMGSWPIGTAKITLSGDADINYERKDEDNFTSNIPFEIPAEYSFENDFKITDCYFVDCGVSLLDDCCSYTFIIEANGSDYVYVNFFDKDGYYLDSSYENIRDGKNEYIFFNMPECATHIEFSKEKTTKINN